MGLCGHEWSHQVAELFRLKHEALTLALDLPDVLAQVAGVGLSESCGGEARPRWYRAVQAKPTEGGEHGDSKDGMHLTGRIRGLNK